MNILDVFGQKSGSAQAMQTSGSTNVVHIEDRTYTTAYVVDHNTTVGQRGTYSTIQSAITAIVADGIASSSQMGTILVRAAPFGSYVENISIPGGIKLHITGETPSGIRTDQGDFFLQGQVTVGAGATIVFTNCGIDNSGNPTFVNNGGTINLNSVYCTHLSSNSGVVTAYDCSLPDFIITGGDFEAYDCDFASSGSPSVTNANFIFETCNGPASPNGIVLNGTSAGTIYSCIRMAISGSTNGQISILDTSVNSPINLPNAQINFSALKTEFNDFPSSFISSGTAANHLVQPFLQGNVLFRRTFAASGNIANTDQYIAVTSTASPVSLVLPTANVMQGQTFVIKDESGGASANNITITAGAATIDGSASFVINLSYGAINVTFDGTNYFIF